MNIRPFTLLFFLTLISLFSVSGVQAQNTEEEVHIKIETTLGDIVVKLYNETPQHRDNMVKLVKEGFYDNQLFHRVISAFMIQGGDPHSVDAARGQRLGIGGPGYTIPAEFNDHLFHKKGAISAAREPDRVNPGKASSGSQFYLVQGQVFTPDMLKMMEKKRQSAFSPEAIEAYTTLGGTPHLDGGYTVFGEIVIGLEIMDQIAAMPTDANDRPLENISYKISLLN